jgi:hypothetical protein
MRIGRPFSARAKSARIAAHNRRYSSGRSLISRAA